MEMLVCCHRACVSLSHEDGWCKQATLEAFSSTAGRSRGVQEDQGLPSSKPWSPGRSVLPLLPQGRAQC